MRNVRISWVVVVAVLAALAAGCEDDRSVRVHGRLLHGDGRPAVGYRLGLGSLSLDWESNEEVRTDADGRYELTGRWKSEPIEGERLGVSVRSLEGTYPLHFSVPARSGDHAVPDVALWDDALRIEEDPDGSARVSWNAAPVGTGSVYELVVHQAGSTTSYAGYTWYAKGLTVTSVDLPAEVFEDRFATVSVLVGDSRYDFGCEKSLCVGAVSGSATKPRADLVPVSRDAVCSAESGGVQVELLGPAGGPCGLTDGTMTLPRGGEWFCGSEICSVPSDVTVDLGAVVPVRTVVVHGLVVYGTGAKLEVSANGQWFDPVQSIQIDDQGLAYEVIRTDERVTARYVRVSVESGGIHYIDELSVF